MGDLNGIDIAQAIHEAVLERAGMLKPESKIIYGLPAPVGNVWEGAYTDDVLVTQRMSMPYDIPLDGSFVRSSSLRTRTRPPVCSGPNTRASGEPHLSRLGVQRLTAS